MIADIGVGGSERPATVFVFAELAGELEAVVLGSLREHDVVVVDAHLNVRGGVDDGWESELEISGEGGAGERAEETENPVHDLHYGAPWANRSMKRTMADMES